MWPTVAVITFRPRFASALRWPCCALPSLTSVHNGPILSPAHCIIVGANCGPRLLATPSAHRGFLHPRRHVAGPTPHRNSSGTAAGFHPLGLTSFELTAKGDGLSPCHFWGYVKNQFSSAQFLSARLRSRHLESDPFSSVVCSIILGVARPPLSHGNARCWADRNAPITIA